MATENKPPPHSARFNCRCAADPCKLDTGRDGAAYLLPFESPTDLKKIAPEQKQ